MIYENTKELKDRIIEVTGRKVCTSPQIVEDTTNYMSIASGCVLRLGENDFYVITDATEGRFGVDDQPKFWVKYAIDLETGDRKVIKLTFYEEFVTHIGIVRIRCTRSPQKESTILNAVRGKPHFMQGVTIEDPAGNLARIIDIVPGRSLYMHIGGLDMTHEEYYYQALPGIMKKTIDCINALVELHGQGEHHGDVRSDHILIDKRNGLYTWIDFDYQVNYSDYDLWNVGNLLIRIIGKDAHTAHDVRTRSWEYPSHNDTILKEDMTLLQQDRIANLRKLFPYIPRELNDILMRFSVGSTEFYSNFKCLIADLKTIF
ncbi:MAG: hypothetical protein GY847_15730 [Proteobacteria bacterium]|nr:hypothetical protein [Pseudomonadota bacterium]